jgi:hypothetical protein
MRDGGPQEVGVEDATRLRRLTRRLRPTERHEPLETAGASAEID